MSEQTIERALGRIEGKLEGIALEQQRIAEYVAATSHRVGSLERKASHRAGWLAGIGATGGGVGAFVVLWVRNLLGID